MSNDLYVTTDDIQRIRFTDLDSFHHLTCDKTGGWALWTSDPDLTVRPPAWTLLASEFDIDKATGKGGLRLDLDGNVFVDSLSPERRAAVTV